MRLFLLIIWLLSAPTFAQTFEDGLQAVQREDYRTAFDIWMPMAKQGDANAQFALGLMYVNGEGVPKNDAEAVRWFRKAAEQSDASAQYKLGSMYVLGKGVPKSDAEAARWYRKAAEQGNARAQFVLGVVYLIGKGVPKNYVQAYKWVNLAAAQGEVTRVGGSPRELLQALSRLMTPQQIAEGQRLSGEIRPKQQSATAPKAPPLSQPLVLDVQRLLSGLGHNPGPIDGLLGAKTLAAVRAFQADAGIKPDGIVSESLLALLKIVKAAMEQPQAPRSVVRPTVASTGTGFLVSEHHAVTNHHVIDGCTSVRVGWGGDMVDASVVAADDGIDIAVLRLPTSHQDPAVFRASNRPRLGEPVTVAGYPLRGLLADDLNISSGNISALAGVGDNRAMLQISAPVQIGNSGGPLLDANGNVIGVVVSKLNAVKTVELVGDLPQNVNFAVKGSLAKSFLDINGIDYRTTPSGTGVSMVVVAAKARKFTVVVECWK